MLRLAAKVWFYSDWGRLGIVFLLNVLSIGSVSLGLVVPAVFPVGMAMGLFLIVASFALSPLLVSGRIIQPGMWLQKTLRLLPAAMVWVVGWGAAVFLILQTGWLFYAGMAWAVFWIFYQGWFAATAHMDVRVFEALRQAWLLVWDSPRASAAMAGGTVLLAGLSLLGLGFFPGFSGMAHWWGAVLRLRRLGYAWQRENPEHAGPLPWSVILADESAVYKGRILKNLLFPLERLKVGRCRRSPSMLIYVNGITINCN